jgi:3-hydroxymyristoyl/3-hydroxydecanoyl-(acyl carrier protein) dehydratase
MGTVTTLAISAQHPAFSGHFPGTPILPGVVLLDEAVRAVELATAPLKGRWQIASAKFLKPVQPGETLSLEHEQLPNGSVRFIIRSGGQPVASGMLVPSAKPSEPDNGHQAG